MEVDIKTFVNPHLFWIIEKSIETRASIANIQNLVKNDHETLQNPDCPYFIEPGQIVGIYYDGRFCRASVENIPLDEKYLCFLLDYGKMVEVQKGFKLSSSTKRIPPLAKQACLNNVVYTTQILSYDEDPEGEMVLQPSLVANNIIKKQIHSLLNKFSLFEFGAEESSNGILLGDIIMKTNNEKCSLIETLIDDKAMIRHEKLFEEVIKNIDTLKDKYQTEILELSNQNKKIVLNLSEYEERVVSPQQTFLSLRKSRNSSQISTDLCNELNNTQLSNNESINIASDSSREYRKKRQKIFSKFNNNEVTSDESDFSAVSNEVSPHAASSSSDTKQKRSLLDNLRKLSKKNQLSENSNSTSTNITPSLDSSQNEFELSSGSNKNAYILKTQGPLCPESSSRRRLTKGTELIPAGATYSNQRKSKSNQYESLSSLKISSNNICKTKVNSVKSIQSDVEIVQSNDSKTNQSDKGCAIKNPYRCSCSQCSHYEVSLWESVNQIFQTEKAPINTNEGQAEMLLRPDGSDKPSTQIYTINYSEMTTVERQKAPTLFFNSPVKVEPLKTVASGLLHPDIMYCLRRKDFTECKKVQVYSWPSILRQTNTCIISNRGTGKTMAYLPIILTFLREKRFDHFPKFGGPFVIILCNNSQECEYIYDLTNAYLDKKRLKVLLATYPLIRHARDVELLITLPRVLLELLSKNVLNLKRLCTLVIENADVVMERDRECMGKIFHLCNNVLSKRSMYHSIQLVSVATHWTKTVEKLVLQLNSIPSICIGNFLEAAIYGRVDIKMKFLDSACKEMELKHILQDNYKVLKSIIICAESEIELIQTILNIKGIECIAINPEVHSSEAVDEEEAWSKAKPGNYKVLICCDKTFNTALTITSANILIHYSLPRTWTRFSIRHGCFLESVSSIFENKPKKHMESIVFIDEHCHDQMLKFLHYIRSLEIQDLPENVINYFNCLVDEKETIKINNNVPLCIDLKLFGKTCTKKCQGRHKLDKNLDTVENIPSCGKIQFKIIKVIDVTRFAIRIVAHKPPYEKFKNVEVSDITAELTEYLNNIQKEVLVTPILNHLYAYRDSNSECYYRCRVHKIEKKLIYIILLDEVEDILTVKASKLYKLPKEFKTLEPQSVEMFIGNCIPPFEDEVFSAYAMSKINEWLVSINVKDIIFTADIYLQLNRTFWLKNIVEFVGLGEVNVCRMQMEKKLLEMQLVQENNIQLSNLYSLCKNSGIEVPILEKMVIKNRKIEQVTPQWAFLDQNDINNVLLMSVINPNEFYVILNKFYPELTNLRRDIQSTVKKSIVIEVGKCYLALNPNVDEFCRVLILNVDKDKALCFCVDFGDELVVNKNDLKYLPNQYIAKLPFQAIQCSLVGIKSILDEWQTEAVDALYGFSFEPDTDIYRSLFIKTCDKIRSSVPGQNKYSVLLKDGYNAKQTLINRLMLDCGFASENGEVIDDFKIREIFYEDSDQDFDEDDDSVSEPALDVIRNDVGHFCDDDFVMEDPVRLFGELFRTKVEPRMLTNDVQVESPAINPLSRNDQSTTDRIGLQNDNFNMDTKPDMLKEKEHHSVIAALPKSNHLTPDVTWSQNDRFVNMDIRLIDCDNYELKIKDRRMLTFKTNLKGKTYALTLMLFGRIDSYQHTSMGRLVSLKMIKVKEEVWPKLYISKQKMHNIKYDMNQIKTDDEENKKILTMDISDDSSLDSGAMYVVVSDQDSEYDLEVPEES